MFTAGCCMFFLFLAADARAGEPPAQVPIIYSTDLYHPHDDPDDHFDLATLFAMREFDIRAIIIDCGERGKGRPGIPAIEQMSRLTGKKPPLAVGLTANLRNMEDDASSQAAEAQKGVELLLSVLRESDKPVTIFETGSMRDVAAAFNRAPELFKTKVARIYANAGNTNGKDIEWNVSLDVNAYRRVMESDLPVYWVPCFGTEARQSFWVFRQSDVLDKVKPELQRFFVCALEQTPVANGDPVAALTSPISEQEKAKWWPQERSMWCTAAFLHAAGRKGKTFAFTPVKATFEKDGKSSVGESGKKELQTIQILDPKGYRDEMTAALQEILSKI